MIDEKKIEGMRHALNKQIMGMVGPMAAIVLNDLIKQLPQGNHVQGWFLPDHKGIQKSRKLTAGNYFLITNILRDKGLIYKQRKAMGARRGVWYKINFDMMTDMVRGEG